MAKFKITSHFNILTCNYSKIWMFIVMFYIIILYVFSVYFSFTIIISRIVRFVMKLCNLKLIIIIMINEKIVNKYYDSIVQYNKTK
jgi:hypothetical protein